MIGMKRGVLLGGNGREGEVNNVQRSKQYPVDHTMYNLRYLMIPFHILLLCVIPKNTQCIEHGVNRTQQVPNR